VGAPVGTWVGTAVGPTVGLDVGPVVGTDVGREVGPPVGPEVGAAVGLDVGTGTGPRVGSRVGFFVGLLVGDDVGLSVTGQKPVGKTKIVVSPLLQMAMTNSAWPGTAVKQLAGVSGVCRLPVPESPSVCHTKSGSAVSAGGEDPVPITTDPSGVLTCCRQIDSAVHIWPVGGS